MTKNHLQHLPPNPEGTNRAARDFFCEASTLLWGLPPFDVNLLGMHHLPRRKPFAEATPATPNLLVASTEDIPLVEEDFLGTPPALTASSGTDPNFSWVGVLVSDHLR